jgi:hypothetical protein
MHNHLRRYLPAIVIAFLSFTIASLAIIAGRTYVYSVAAYNTRVNPGNIFGTRMYAVYMTILNYDSSTHTLTALTHSPAVNQDIKILYRANSNLTITRQDTILDGDAYTRQTLLQPGTIDDLQPNTHAIAVVRTEDDGTMSLSSLLIGNPFPHP